ncbi:hypothetical protein [Paenibacillus agricola]|uniref:Uncharacterized protein n=1 Tax=Paenibacillus agricola TaxID=2716264 RepID=A0ABX0J2M1_9BACL|nr:hypothetical protein [Paenibacillus agricola]NHN29671.1 hypothetical protein [Paenibacillus agricola]
MKIKKPWMAAILSMALLFNGAAALTPTTFADDEDLPIFTKVKAPFDGQRFMTDWLGRIIIHTAAIADKDYIDIQDALQAGQTLTQASGLNGAFLDGQLQGILAADLNLYLQNYTATPEYLANLKADLNNAIQKAISTPGYITPGTKGQFNYKALIDFHINQLKINAAYLSEEDYIDINDRLLQGSTLAQAASLNENELLEALLRPILQEIDIAVKQGQLASIDGSKFKDQARVTIFSAISTPGSFDITKAVTKTFLQTRLNSILTDAYLVTNNEDLEFMDMKSSYKNGASLTQITGIPAMELTTKIMELWKYDWKAATSSWTAEELSAFEQQASQAIQTAITAASK